jgi:hypothetical protein
MSFELLVAGFWLLVGVPLASNSGRRARFPPHAA